MKENQAIFPFITPGSKLGIHSRRFLVAGIALSAAANGFAAVHYVDLNSANPTPPYTNWATAAVVIQNAVDAAAAGDEVVVTNGIYATGGRPAGTNTQPNRVAAEIALILRSINGPTFTVIDGRGSARCVYLAAGATLCGFTLTNGLAYQSGSNTNGGGGVWCASRSTVVSDCVISSNRAGLRFAIGWAYGGGAVSGTLNNCVLSGNSVDGVGDTQRGWINQGGGAYDSAMSQCILAGNYVSDDGSAAPFGGGASHCTLDHCTLTGNSAGGEFAGYGGGAAYSSLNDCTVSSNRAWGISYGAAGGVYACTVTNSTLTANVALADGGAAAQSILDGCTVSNNLGAYGDLGGGGGVAGGTLTKCILTDNQSGSGGGGAYGDTYWPCFLDHCQILNNSVGDGGGGGALGCTLDDCVLRGNMGSYEGGGADTSVLNRCTIIGNEATTGGGAAYSTLNNCVLWANSAYAGWSSGVGGGAAGSTLNNCTLTDNSADDTGGGAWNSILNNCIVYFNDALSGPDYDTNSFLSYCCTMPMPPKGFGNITRAPQFVDIADGNLRLQSNSPCVNAGNNSYVTNTADLDGDPRISGGTVDIGAYECQNPASIISYAWLQQYGLPMDGSADFTDPDGDGMNNWQEWRCGTNPHNALSALRLLAPTVTGTNVVVRWQSVPGIVYSLQRSTNVAAPLVFAPLAGGIPGQSNITSYPDTNALGAGPVFYRIGVR